MLRDVFRICCWGTVIGVTYFIGEIHGEANVINAVRKR